MYNVDWMILNSFILTSISVGFVENCLSFANSLEIFVKNENGWRGFSIILHKEACSSSNDIPSISYREAVVTLELRSIISSWVIEFWFNLLIVTFRFALSSIDNLSIMWGNTSTGLFSSKVRRSADRRGGKLDDPDLTWTIDHIEWIYSIWSILFIYIYIHFLFAKLRLFKHVYILTYLQNSFHVKLYIQIKKVRQFFHVKYERLKTL